MRKQLGKLKVTQAQMQSSSKKVGELAARRKSNGTVMTEYSIRPAVLQGLGNASVLTVRDAEYEFFDDLKEEILKADCHWVPRKFLHYPRLEMIKIIFKLTAMELEFLTKTQQQAYLKQREQAEAKVKK